MNFQKKCSNCNNIINENTNFSSYCGTKIQQNNEIVNKQDTIPEKINKNEETPEEKKVGNTIALIALGIFFLANNIIMPLANIWLEKPSPIASCIDLLCPVVGIITMIYGRIKYPKNQSLKIAMWTMIHFIIFAIVMYIYLLIACNAICESFPD